MAYYNATRQSVSQPVSQLFPSTSSTSSTSSSSSSLSTQNECDLQSALHLRVCSRSRQFGIVFFLWIFTGLTSRSVFGKCLQTVHVVVLVAVFKLQICLGIFMVHPSLPYARFLSNSIYSIGPVATRHRPTADLTSCVSFDLLCLEL